MTLINRKIDKIRQKAFISSAASDKEKKTGAAQESAQSDQQTTGRNRIPLSAQDSDILKQLINVRSALMREKATSDELCDNIETTDREIKEMHFQDTQQVRNEIEDSRRDFMREKAKYDEIMRRKQEISNKIELFK